MKPTAMEPDLSLLASILECSGAMVAAVSCERRFLYCNKAYGEHCRDVHGVDVRPGVPLDDIFPGGEQEQDHIREIWRRALDDETFTEVVPRNHASRLRFIEIHACPAVAADGNKLGAVLSMRDVTERERSRRRMEESERDFRRMFHDAPTGAARVHLEDFTFLEVNRALCALTGYSAQELIGKTFMDITHPEDVLVDVEQATRLRNGDIDHYEMEKRYLCKDGSSIWVRLWVRLIFNAEGEPMYYLPIIEDISEQKHAEAQLLRQQARLEQEVLDRTRKLEESQALHRAIVREFPNGALLLFDHDLRFLLAGGRVLGFDEEMVGKTMQEVLHPELAATLEPAYRSALKGRNVRMELDWLGEAYEMRISPVHGENGEVLWDSS